MQTPEEIPYEDTPAAKRARIARENGRRSKGPRRIITTHDARLRMFQIAKSGQSPVDIMFENMVFFHQQAIQLTSELVDRMRNLDLSDPDERKAVFGMLNKMVETRTKSQDCAVDLAPYIHPRLAQITVKPDGDVPDLKPEDVPNDATLASQVYQRLIAGPKE